MAFENLTRGLMNPSYTGMLTQNIQGGMQGISNAILGQKQNMARDAQMRLLTHGNPDDPATIKAFQDIGQMHNLPAEESMAMLLQAQQSNRAKEQLKASLENQKIQQENLKLRKDELQRQQKTQEIEQKVWLAGADVKKLKEMYPEHAGFIEKQWTVRKEAEAKRADWANAERMKQPLGEDYLKQVADQGDAYAMAVENYRRDKSAMGPIDARRRFDQQMSNLDRQEASREFLREQTRGYANSWAADFIKAQDWGGFFGFGRQIPEEAEAALVPQVAQYYLENREAPTKDQMIQWATQWVNGTAAATHSVQSSPGDAWHGMSVEDLIQLELEGSKVSWGSGRSQTYKYTITRQEALERLKARGIVKPNA